MSSAMITDAFLQPPGSDNDAPKLTDEQVEDPNASATESDEEDHLSEADEESEEESGGKVQELADELLGLSFEEDDDPCTNAAQVMKCILASQHGTAVFGFKNKPRGQDNMTPRELHELFSKKAGAKGMQGILAVADFIGSPNGQAVVAAIQKLAKHLVDSSMLRKQGLLYDLFLVISSLNETKTRVPKTQKDLTWTQIISSLFVTQGGNKFRKVIAAVYDLVNNMTMLADIPMAILLRLFQGMAQDLDRSEEECEAIAGLFGVIGDLAKMSKRSLTHTICTFLEHLGLNPMPLPDDCRKQLLDALAIFMKEIEKTQPEATHQLVDKEINRVQKLLDENIQELTGVNSAITDHQAVKTAMSQQDQLPTADEIRAVEGKMKDLEGEKELLDKTVASLKKTVKKFTEKQKDMKDDINHPVHGQAFGVLLANIQAVLDFLYCEWQRNPPPPQTPGKDQEEEEEDPLDLRTTCRFTNRVVKLTAQRPKTAPHSPVKKKKACKSHQCEKAGEDDELSECPTCHAPFGGESSFADQEAAAAPANAADQVDESAAPNATNSVEEEEAATPANNAAVQVEEPTVANATNPVVEEAAAEVTNTVPEEEALPRRRTKRTRSQRLKETSEPADSRPRTRSRNK